MIFDAKLELKGKELDIMFQNCLNLEGNPTLQMNT